MLIGTSVYRQGFYTDMFYFRESGGQINTSQEDFQVPEC